MRKWASSSPVSAGVLLVVAGFIALFLAWNGAASKDYVEGQLPYVISGGLLGLSLVFVGCFFYFAHWLTQLVKEHREQSAAIIAAIERLTEAQQHR